MAINTATIQHRRGRLEDFNPEKLMPGEIAVITDERSVHMGFPGGETEKIVLEKDFTSESIKEKLGYEPADEERVDQLFRDKADYQYVDKKVSNVKVDLTGYAKEDYVDAEIEELNKKIVQETGKLSEEKVDQKELENYALKDEIPTVPVQSVNGKTGAVQLSASEVGALPNSTKIPANTSDLKNNSGFITKTVTDLANYYLKTEVYTQEEIDNKLSAIPKFAIEVVSTLPTANISETTVYLIASGNEEHNLYTEYIYVDGQWEYLGKQTVDLTNYVKRAELSNYYLKSEMDSLLTTIRNSIPTQLSQFTEDSTHRTVTDTEKKTWNAKSNFSGAYGDLTGKPTIPTKTSQLTNDSNFVDKSVTDKLSQEIANVTTLPYGGSKDWLEANGDKTKLYQIDGYTWGYIESNGWTQSGTQFLVVSSESEMTNVGGTEYLLRSDSEGTVYKYTEASGDIDVPVYDSLPEVANDGDIVAVGGRKYQATLTTVKKPKCENNFADPTSSDWAVDSRFSSAGAVSAIDGLNADISNYVPIVIGSVVQVYGMDLTSSLSNGSICRSAIYANDNVLIGAFSNASQSFISVDDYGITTINIEDSIKTAVGSALDPVFIRVNGTLTDTKEDVIITVDEEIIIEDESVVSWTDVGEYITPVKAGWNATEDIYAVIDSLSATANNGDSAVYSVDGFLYSYIDGADWMKMGEYNFPTLTVDSELSDSSTNAVQNKVVTEAIENIRKDITDISDKVTSEAVTIPEYWEDAVSTAVEKIKEKQNLGGYDCIDFINFGDIHTIFGGENFAHNVGKLSRHIMDKCDIDLANFLGDWVNSAGEDTKEQTFDDVEVVKKILEPIIKKLCTILGNHDLFFNGNTHTVSKEELYNAIFRHLLKNYRIVFGEDGTYYRLDNIPQKVRHIYLNGNWAEWTVSDDGTPSYTAFAQGGYGQKQLEFLAESLKVESGWSICIYTHVPPIDEYRPPNTNYDYVRDVDVLVGIINAYIDKTTYTGSYTGEDYNGVIRDWAVVNISVDYTAEEGEIIAMFTAHRHLDEVFTDVIKRPIITITTCSGQKLKDGHTRTYGTDTETALDVVTINKKTRTIYCTRLGVGDDREISY